MSWKLLSIDEFCRTGSGGTPSRLKPEYFEGNIPWIKSGDLRENVVEIANEFITENAVKNSSAKIVSKGAILIAMYGATVGRMAILGIDAATNQAVCNVIPDETIAHTKYVYYALQSKVPEFLQNAVGGAQPNISQGMIRDTKIPLPPLEEQKRIAAILDKADAIRSKRQEAFNLADEFLRAVFLDMFVQNTKKAGWKKVSINDVTIKVKTWNPLVNKDLVFEYIDLSSVDNNSKKITDSKLFEGKDAPSRARQLVISGDVLVSTVRPNLNGVAKVNKNSDFLTASTGFCVLRPNTEQVTQNFLFHLVRSAHFVSEMVAIATGASYPAVSDKIIKTYEFELPPLSIQHSFDKLCEKIESYQLRNTEFSKMGIFDSLSQKVFSGNL